MAVIFPAGGLKPSVDADLIVGIAGEAIAYGDAVYQVLLTGQWWVSDANSSAAARNVDGLALNVAAVGQQVIIVRRDPNLTTGTTTGEVLAAGKILRLSGLPGKLQLVTSAPGSNAVVVGAALSATAMNFKVVEGGEVPGGVTYVRSAFVSAGGDDALAALNDMEQPYASVSAAVGELAAAYPGLTTTIRYLTNVSVGLEPSAALNTLLAAGLTMMSHDEEVKALSASYSFGSQAGALLTLSKVQLTALVKVGRDVASAANAGTITGDADTRIVALIVSSDNSFAGASSGAAGASGIGSAGADGTGYGNPGSGGSDVNGVGGDAGHGEAGHFAWDVTLAGEGLIDNLLGEGGIGGYGGAGGNGGNATGGPGGAGSIGTPGDEAHPDGGFGGAGGNGGGATAGGGDGGNGGNGGNGSTVTKAAGWTILASSLVAGAGGVKGSGGSAGSATGGAAGAGGAGGIGAYGFGGVDGTPGADGDSGAATSYGAGDDGEDGVAGSDGSII